MLSPLRNRFGIPGVISVIALVFAMLGGAYAASNNGSSKATVSAKGKPGPRGKTGKTGPAGPSGPQGPAGSAGAKGDTGAAGSNGKDGTNGTNGTNGSNGKSAETVAFVGSQHGCTEGGIEVKSASPVAFICNGVKGTNGESGFTETLPSTKTETGTWGGQLPGVASGTEAKYAISFPIPLSAPISETNVIMVLTSESPVNEHCDNAEGEVSSAVNPEADAGYLCVFQGLLGKPLGTGKVDGNSGAAASGAILGVQAGFGGNVFGSWAVTAP